MGSVVEVTEMESKRGTHTIERSRERKKEKSPSSPPRPYDTRKGKDGLFVLAG